MNCIFEVIWVVLGPLSEDFVALVGVWSRVWSRFGRVTMAFPCDFVNFT